MWIYNDESMDVCSVFAGESLPIDAVMSGGPGRYETTHLVILFLHLPSPFPFPCTKWHMATLPTQQTR